MYRNYILFIVVVANLSMNYIFILIKKIYIFVLNLMDCIVSLNII